MKDALNRRDDELLARLAAADPVDRSDLPDSKASAAQQLLVRAMTGLVDERPRTGERGPSFLRVALATLALASVAASFAFAGPGRAAIAATMDEVSSWFGGEATVVATDTGEETGRVRANGIITSAVSDERGGWYISGGFTEINGEPRSHLAHILANGDLDPAWTPQLGGDAKPPYIYAMLAYARGRLYAAGPFTHINGRHVGNVVALHASTGEVAPEWSANTVVPDGITALASIDSRLYVGVTGRAIVEGQARHCLVALDGSRGNLVEAFKPPISFPGELNCVTALAADDGAMFAAGTFGLGERSATVVKIDPTTGAIDPNFSVGELSPGNASVLALAAADDALYVGGGFTAVAGEPRRGLVALDPKSGRLIADWVPSASAGEGRAHVFTLLSTPDHILVGGDFDTIDGQGSKSFAILVRETGKLVRSNALSDADYVLALALSEGSALAGGKSEGEDD